MDPPTVPIRFAHLVACHTRQLVLHRNKRARRQALSDNVLLAETSDGNRLSKQNLAAQIDFVVNELKKRLPPTPDLYRNSL